MGDGSYIVHFGFYVDTILEPRDRSKQREQVDGGEVIVRLAREGQPGLCGWSYHCCQKFAQQTLACNAWHGNGAVHTQEGCGRWQVLLGDPDYAIHSASIHLMFALEL